MTKASELRELNDVELEHRLTEAKEELFNLRFQNATGQLDNTARLGHVRKDIARLETLLREREITAAEVMSPEEESQDAGLGGITANPAQDPRRDGRVNENGQDRRGHGGRPRATRPLRQDAP